MSWAKSPPIVSTTRENIAGKSRAGVYCAANVAIEQVIEHGEIDVFQAVRTVRRHRVQLVENMVSSEFSRAAAPDGSRNRR